jgi:hypothetical protein
MKRRHVDKEIRVGDRGSHLSHENAPESLVAIGRFLGGVEYRAVRNGGE